MAGKEVSVLVRRLQKNGYDVTMNGSGHWNVRASGGGKFYGTIPATPSDYRWLENCVAQLRKNGVPAEMLKAKERTRRVGELSERQKNAYDGVMKTVEAIGSKAEVGRYVMEMQKRPEFTRRFPTLDAYQNCLTRLRNSDPGVATWMIELLEKAVEEINQVAPAPMAEVMAKKGVKRMGSSLSDKARDQLARMVQATIEQNELSAIRAGRKSPYGLGPKMAEWVMAWAERTGTEYPLATLKASRGVSAALSSRLTRLISHPDESLWSTTKAFYEAALEAWDSGFDPFEPIEEPLMVQVTPKTWGELFDEGRADDPDEQSWLDEPLPSESFELPDASGRKIVYPLHMRVLVKMMAGRTADYYGGHQDILELADQVRKLEERS